MPLPLADLVRYDEFILRVPWQEVAKVSEYVLRFWQQHDAATIEVMQRKARAAFEQYLYMPAYLRHVLTREYLARVPRTP
jgi:hypothetical protein